MISKKAISDIYCTYNKELFNYLVKICGNIDLAEDLLQETFENFIDYALEHHIDEKTVRPFLYRTAHNLSVNYHVRQSKRKMTDIDDHAETIGCNDNSQNSLEAKELEERVSLFINNLPPEDRSVFLMHKEFGKTYDEIAADTGISSRTVRRRVRTIIDDLVKTLKSEGFLEQ